MQQERMHIPPTPRIESQYLDLLMKIRDHGTESDDRTGVGTRKLFGEKLVVDMLHGFPLLTTKKLPFRIIKEELLWFIRGERNIKPLVDKSVNIWNEWPLKNYLQKNGKKHVNSIDCPQEWNSEMEMFVEKIKTDDKFALKWGDLGPVYGYQWRHWKNPNGTEIDQLSNAVDLIKNSPNSRRIIVNAWNPSDIEAMAISGLPPCHMEFQFQVDRNKLNLAMRQRSVDSFLGLPFNIASYALLLEIVANITDKEPGNLTLFLGDVHIYKSHIDAVNIQLSREPQQPPILIIDQKIKSIDNIESDTIRMINYNPSSHIPAPIAV